MLTKEEFLSHLYEQYENPLEAEAVLDGEYAKYHLEAYSPPMPDALPEPIKLLTSHVPDHLKPAVAMSVFPPLGAHYRDTRFHYIDNRDYEPTFMCVLAAEMSSGKSAINKPIKYIMADIEERDEENRQRDHAWKAECERLGANRTHPKRPEDLVIQQLPADMNNAVFVQRLMDAKGRFLYTQVDEIDLLSSFTTNIRGRLGASAVIRLAFDCAEYGQVRVGPASISGRATIRWNWNASSTIQRVRKFFAEGVADGTLSRISFATIVCDPVLFGWGNDLPVFGEYGPDFADQLKPFIEALNLCGGIITCPEALTWAKAERSKMVNFARESDDKAYAIFSRRAVLMGFFRAMTLYVMNGMQWTPEIEAFASWSTEYDMWCKCRFFHDLMLKEINGEAQATHPGPRNLLDQLPAVFTRADAMALRLAEGKKGNPSDMLRQWKSRGYIIPLDKNTFKKLPRE